MNFVRTVLDKFIGKKAIRLTISGMELRKYVSLLLLLAFPCCALPQSKPQSSAANPPITQQPGSISETYSETIAMIKAWTQTEENNELGRLFTIGDLRTSDLLAACHSADDEIASAAFLVLRLLGKSECESCGDLISSKHNGVAFVCAADLADVDFTRIEAWLARKHNRDGYKCGDEYEPLTPMDDSVVYALILDGSPRSKLILKRMLAIEKACVATGTTIIGEVLSQAESLVAAAKRMGSSLRFEPDSLEEVIRPSAFFLPSKYRKDSRIEVIAHNKTEDRILLEVSYVCGRLCGSGYWVVLRKKDTTWQYAVIAMAWIS